ncbi:MAG: tetratricopeptide repeat protein [Myxococcales bacterium]
MRLQMAQALVRMGLPDAASRELERVPEEARGAELLFAIGRVRQSQGDMAGARESLEAANEALPENPEFYRLRGVLFFNDAQIEEAEADFNRAIELAPRDMEGNERLARFYVRIGQLEKAVQAYQAAIEIDPAAAPIHHSLGELYERRSQPERAIEHYESAIEHGSENIETKNNLAYLYADRGEQLSRALDLAHDAKRLLPDNPSISDTLGWVLYKRGLSGAAIAYLEEAAAKSDPKGGSIAMIRFHLAMALDAEGESARALESVEHSLKDLTARRFASLAAGKATTEINPSWVAEARTLRDRLEAVQASANS